MTRKNFCLAVILPLILCGPFFAEKAPPEPAHSFEYREIAQLLQEPLPPFEKDGAIVFSAHEGPRYVGIAFDFENYQIIHPFLKKTTYDENLKAKKSWYFYILEDVPETKRIYYRMIIDGLWTTDPLNPRQFYDTETGIHLSEIQIQTEKTAVTRINTRQGEATAHFVYRGQSGQKVRLAGTFTKWDSWIYELKETAPGFYEFDLPLSRGTYYYNYYIGTKQFPDAGNPSRAFSDSGLPVSKLVVE